MFLGYKSGVSYCRKPNRKSVKKPEGILATVLAGALPLGLLSTSLLDRAAPQRAKDHINLLKTPLRTVRSLRRGWAHVTVHHQGHTSDASESWPSLRAADREACGRPKAGQSGAAS
jgi:hypothetical protein